MGRLIALAALALLAAAAQPAGGSVRSAPADLVLARAPHGLVLLDGRDGQVLRRLADGAAGPGWKVVYQALPGAATTTVRTLDVATGRVLRQRVIRGRW